MNEYTKRIDAIWDALVKDPKLKRARKVLSIHEMRMMIRHAALAFGYCTTCRTSWATSEPLPCPVCTDEMNTARDSASEASTPK